MQSVEHDARPCAPLRWILNPEGGFMKPVDVSRRALSIGIAALGLVISLSAAAQNKPNILVLFGDDIGQTNVSAYSLGLMGYRTPNIDRIAKEGMLFTDYYAEQSCTAGRSTFITGQATLRTGLSKVGVPGT